MVLPKLIEQGRHGFFVSNEIDKEEMRLLPQGLQHNVQTVVQLQLLHHPERAQERPVDMVVLVLLVGEQGVDIFTQLLALLFQRHALAVVFDISA